MTLKTLGLRIQRDVETAAEFRLLGALGESFFGAGSPRRSTSS